MILAQMFPGMEWIPVLTLGTHFVLATFVIGGVSVVVSLLPIARWRQPCQWMARASVFVFLIAGISIAVWRNTGPSVEECQQIQLGMPMEEVRNILGEPPGRNVYEDGRESWYYYPDWMGLSWFMVQFDPNGIANKKWLE